jgi:hypothetical protein
MLWPKKKSLKLRCRSARQACDIEPPARAGSPVVAGLFEPVIPKGPSYRLDVEKSARRGSGVLFLYPVWTSTCTAGALNFSALAIPAIHAATSMFAEIW